MAVQTMFIDVDLTLVDAQGNLRQGVEKALNELWAYGYQIYIWSHGGAQRARDIIKQYGLGYCIVDCLSKPDIIIDDSPPEELADRSYYLRCDSPGWWTTIWEHIFHKDVSFARDTEVVALYSDPEYLNWLSEVEAREGVCDTESWYK